MSAADGVVDAVVGLVWVVVFVTMVGVGLATLIVGVGACILAAAVLMTASLGAAERRRAASVYRVDGVPGVPDADGRPSAEKAMEMIATTFAKGSHAFEWKHLRADGVPIDVQLLLTTLHRDNRRLLHVVWNDVTEQKSNQRELAAYRLELERRVAIRTAELAAMAESLRVVNVEQQAIFNTVGSLLGMGAMQFFAPILAKNYEGGYASAGFFRTLAPVGIVISILLTILAIIGIWEKDQPKYFGIGGEVSEKVKLHEYVQIIKNNNPMQRLMVAGAGCKLALSIATNTTVLCMLYGCMMGNYDGLYLPMMVLGYVFSVPFFLLTVRTSQKEGQKASLMKYVSVAFICYIGVLVLLLLWGRSDAFTLSIMGDNGLSINLYTILFIAFFGIGYGAYYATADMPIPMVADCSDYETYRSGNYIPGIMGTLFSLVDKLVSSLSATVVGIAVSFVGLQSLPTQYDPYTPGMNWVVIVLFCIIPMVAWAATLIAMKGYTLTGAKMKEIQAVNACRRDAVAKGMKLEEAMDKWQTMDQLPAEYRS